MTFGSRKEIAKQILESKDYRNAYNWSYLKRHIPFQIRTMRTERDWSQAKAGEILGKPQNVISRLESPSYSKLTLQTLLEIAQGFDVGLVIKFVPYSQLLREYEDVSFNALSAPSPTEKFKDEIEAIWDWANEKEDSGFWEESVPEENKRPISESAKQTITQFIGSLYELPPQETFTPNEKTPFASTSQKTTSGRTVDMPV